MASASPASANHTASTAITGGPANGSFSNSNSATFTFTMDAQSQAEGYTFACSLDDPSWHIPDDWVYPCPPPKSWSGLSDGQHTFRVAAGEGDAGGYQAVGPHSQTWNFTTAASSTWTVDTVAPNTTITSGPANSSYVSTSQVSFSFSSNDPTASFGCSIDGGTFTSCTSPKTYTLADGSHTFKVRATDQATNFDATPDQRTFTVDTVDPNTTITSGPAAGAEVNTLPVSFGFSATEPSKFTCQLTGPTSIGPETCQAGYVTSGSRSYSSLQPGNYTFTVFATDRANRSDATVATRSFTYVAPSGVCDQPGSVSIYDGYAGTAYVKLRTYREPDSDPRSFVCVRADNRQGVAEGGVFEVDDPSIGGTGVPRLGSDPSACDGGPGIPPVEIGDPSDPTTHTLLRVNTSGNQSESWVCVNVDSGAGGFHQQVIVPTPGSGVQVPRFTPDPPSFSPDPPESGPSGYPSSRCQENIGGTKDQIANGDTALGHLWLYERRTSNTAQLCFRLAGPATLGGELKVDASGSLVPALVGTDTDTTTCTTNVASVGTTVQVTRSPDSAAVKSICVRSGSTARRIWVDPQGLGTAIIAFTPDSDLAP